MSCPSRTNSSSRWTQLSPSFKTESLRQNETPPAGTSSQNEAQSALQKSVMDNQTMRQAIDQAKQELKNIRQQIADEKSSAQPCNCDYDQLLNNIVHEQVDVNRRSAAQHRQNDVSRYCDFNPPAHHNRTADRSRFGSSKPLLEHQADDNSKPTCCHRITAHFCARNCGRIRPDTD